MSKRLILVLALAFVVGIAFAAYAEVQNVKVGGDLLIRGVARNNLDLKNSGTAGDKESDQASFFMSTVRVKVDADLTDNVGVVVRLLNERLWNVDDDYADNNQIEVDLAYATLKEFLYSPLTVIVGRQPLRVGHALIIGDPDTNRTTTGYATGVHLPAIARDLSARKSFDAIRANLNYDPLVIDLVYAKGYEGDVTRNDDVDVYGVIAKYNLDKKTAIEPYLVVKSSGVNASGAVVGKTDKIYDLGTTIYAAPIENLTTSLEGSWQLGYNNTTLNKRKAWALQAMADYLFAKQKYTPGLGIGYTYLSGDKNTADKRNSVWDPMFEDQTLNSIPNLLFVNSNMQVINVKGSIKPKDDLTLSANYGYYRLAQKVSSLAGYATWTTMSDKKSLGSALDLAATYDYTEDVQLGLDFGWFAPGAAFDTAAGNRDATQLIGSMKVTF